MDNEFKKCAEQMLEGVKGMTEILNKKREEALKSMSPEEAQKLAETLSKMNINGSIADLQKELNKCL